MKRNEPHASGEEASGQQPCASGQAGGAPPETSNPRDPSSSPVSQSNRQECFGKIGMHTDTDIIEKATLLERYQAAKEKRLAAKEKRLVQQDKMRRHFKGRPLPEALDEEVMNDIMAALPSDENDEDDEDEQDDDDDDIVVQGRHLVTMMARARGNREMEEALLRRFLREESQA